MYPSGRRARSTLPGMRRVLGGLVTLALVVGLGGCSGSGVALLSASNAVLGPDSTATRTAQSILHNLNHGDLGATVPLQPCSSVASGHIGPLNAPYKICPISTAIGHFVNFIAVGSPPEYGISFTDRGPETFLDQCYRHLLGQWWEFRSADLSNPAAPCPSDWRFHGGP
jgi:hypothetical protein